MLVCDHVQTANSAAEATRRNVLLSNGDSPGERPFYHVEKSRAKGSQDGSSRAQLASAVVCRTVTARFRRTGRPGFTKQQ
jgi:hypothetical protein